MILFSSVDQPFQIIREYNLQETAETELLKKRLKKAERQSIVAEKKADKALEMAEEAQAIALERQRYREIYVIPERAIDPYPKNRLTTPP